MKITFLSTYPPRQCGLATFAENLIKAIKSNVTKTPIDFQIVALNKQEQFEYPVQVKYQINESSRQDYINTADSINNDGTDLCLIQHEFGIFGGDCGVYALSLVYSLKVPVIVTLHTVLKHPSFLQKAIIKGLAQQAQKLVVMSNTGATFLKEIYEIPPEKVLVIEHGVPKLRRSLALTEACSIRHNNRRIIFTFGLLSRNKGIEVALQALPKVAKKHPDIIYIVLGKTHPNILKESGEQYRNHLQRLVKLFKLEEHVCFMNRFISEEALMGYLQATDIYLTPYLNEAQITSGTLSYAVGAGAAVISTPYWHARELLDEGRGCLFNFGDADRLSKIIIELLDNPGRLNAIKAKAFEYGRKLRWDKVGQRYLNLIKTTIDIYNRPDILIDSIENPFLVPEFDHLKRLTDDTGIIQHAKFGIPNLKEGYCLDDNSRALLAALMAYNISEYKEALNLIPIYLSYIHYMQKAEGTFRNFLSYNKQFLDEEGSEDAFGRTIWALGYLIKHAPNSAYYQLAEEIFMGAAKNFESLRYTRGIANALIGICYYMQKVPDDDKMGQLMVKLVDTLVCRYQQHKSGNWQWFENQLSYDNGILPLALFHSVLVNGSESVKSVAENATDFLNRITLKQGYLSPVGSNGWCHKNSEPAQFAQQATDVMAMVLLNYQAYFVTGKKSYLQNMYQCYRWFFGENDLKIPLYDDETQGCCDGLEANGVNRNQGAESTLAYLISNLTIQQIDALETPVSFKQNPILTRENVLENSYK